jgi:hypothetical protein
LNPASTSTLGNVQTSPSEALSELDGLIAQMLEAGATPSMTLSCARATIVTSSPISSPAREPRAVEQGKEVDSEDIETASENYRELHEFLIEDRAAP